MSIKYSCSYEKISFHSSVVKMYLLTMTCWQMTQQHCTHLEKIFCKSETICKTDQVSSWCDNNHIVINPIKTKSMTIATRQKHQLSPLPFDLILNGAKIDQVSEHRLLGITIDNKILWESHTVLYKISIDCFCFVFQYWLFELIRCSTDLFAGCMLIMCNRVIYECVHLAL